MPDLIRLYITQVIIGFAISAVAVAGLLWFNVANLGHLVTHSDVGLLAAFLLWLFNGIVFAGVQFAIAIMGMADDDDDDDEGGHHARDAIAIPIPVQGGRHPGR
jgi:membrane-anchored glycerophosphoryl diester phosphodiesterase (GDPDase)